MAQRDIVVVGASAGGVHALKILIGSLPSNLGAAVFVVLHTPPYAESALPRILTASGLLFAAHARDGEQIELGRIYVAPPDRHLIVAKGHIHLSNGPKENRTRPAINPLFRSAALAYGPRVAGVLLSGLLDDGTLGLWEIKRRGGIAVVQEPEDAEHREMPANALRNVEVDYRVPLEKMGSVLTELVEEPVDQRVPEVGIMSEPENTNLTCPECHGPLQQSSYGGLIELKCRVGHRYSPQSAVAAHDESEERVLWSAAEALEEGADLVEKVSGYSPDTPAAISAKAKKRRDLAAQIRKILLER
jgi:two-component system, chemotaxis family, protein-glutamate methylesterase/glutaminase